MAGTSAWVSIASNSSAAEIRPRRLQHREALGREFRTNDVERLGRDRARRIEQPVTARPRTPANGRCASARRARRPSPSRERHQVPGHGTHSNVFALRPNAVGKRVLVCKGREDADDASCRARRAAV